MSDVIQRESAAEKISGFIKGLDFKKKKVGGVDEQDVLMKFAELDGLYREAFTEKIGSAKESLREKQETIDALEERVRTLSAELEAAGKQAPAEDGVDVESIKAEYQDTIDELNAKLTEALGRVEEAQAQAAESGNTPAFAFEQLNRMQQENARLEGEKASLSGQLAQMNAQLAEMNRELEEAKKRAESGSNVAGSEMMDNLLAMKSRIWDEAAAEKDMILYRARKEADEIVKEANLEKDQIKLSAYFEISQIHKEKQALAIELKRMLDRISEVLQESARDHAEKMATPPAQFGGQGLEAYETAGKYRSSINAG